MNPLFKCLAESKYTPIKPASFILFQLSSEMQQSVVGRYTALQPDYLGSVPGSAIYTCDFRQDTHSVFVFPLNGDVRKDSYLLVGLLWGLNDFLYVKLSQQCHLVSLGVI